MTSPLSLGSGFERAPDKISYEVYLEASAFTAKLYRDAAAMGPDPIAKAIREKDREGSTSVLMLPILWDQLRDPTEAAMIALKVARKMSLPITKAALIMAGLHHYGHTAPPQVPRTPAAPVGALVGASSASTGGQQFHPGVLRVLGATVQCLGIYKASRPVRAPPSMRNRRSLGDLSTMTAQLPGQIGASMVERLLITRIMSAMKLPINAQQQLLTLLVQDPLPAQLVSELHNRMTTSHQFHLRATLDGQTFVPEIISILRDAAERTSRS